MRSNFCNDAEIARVRDVVWSSCTIYNIAKVVYDIRRMDRLLSGNKKVLSHHYASIFVVLRDKNANMRSYDFF